jgi:hypothetical protein
VLAIPAEDGSAGKLMSAPSGSYAGVTVTGGTVDADLEATITIEGTPTGCTDEGTLPLDGVGMLACDAPGAGAVFASVDAEKTAQAEAESQAENGAEVPYQVNYDGQYYVYARAQVNAAELVQQITAQATREGKLQHAYSTLLSAVQRAVNRTPAEIRASLTPEQLANGRAFPSLRARPVEHPLARRPGHRRVHRLRDPARALAMDGPSLPQPGGLGTRRLRDAAQLLHAGRGVRPGQAHP